MSGSPIPHAHEVISRTRLITKDELNDFIPVNTYRSERWLAFFSLSVYFTCKLMEKLTLDYLTAWNYCFLYMFSYVLLIQPQPRNVAVDTLTAFSQALWFIMRFENRPTGDRSSNDQPDCLGFMIFHELLGLGYFVCMTARKNPKLSFRGFMIHGSTEREERSHDSSSDDDEDSSDDDDEESLHILSILFSNRRLNKILVMGYVISLLFNMGQIFFGGNAIFFGGN